MRYIVFSLGHFFTADLSALKSNLTSYYAKHNRADITGDQVWDFLAKAKDADDHIPLYYLRIGMSLHDFWKTKIQPKFPIECTSEKQEQEVFYEFERAWLSMCKFSPSAEERVREFITYLDDHPETTFIIVSHTNHAQFDDIQQQIKEKFGEKFPYAQFRFVTSMDSKKEMHPDTLAYAFEKGVICLEAGDEVISCLRTIKKEMLPQYIDSSCELPETFKLSDFEHAVPDTRASLRT